MKLSFDTLYIHPELENHPRAKRLVETLPHRRIELIDQADALSASMKTDPAGAVARGKYNVALAPYRGEMVEGCPASPGMRCCRYRVINLVMGCPIDCSYCILQGYLNRPTIFIFPELEKVYEQLDIDIQRCRDEGFSPRFGTGELSDSLALDRYTEFSIDLIEHFRGRPDVWFELKTKSVEIANVLSIDSPPANIVISWSVNPQYVIDAEEGRAPSLSERIDAAVKVQEAGYRLGFHFDPIFYFEGWEEHYEQTVKEIFSRIDPQKVVWISMGGLRFSGWMGKFYRERFRGHRLLTGEHVQTPPDGKFRYPQPIRIELYRKIHTWIRQAGCDAYVYLCMESATAYRWALGIDLAEDPLAVEKGFPLPPG